MDFSAVISALGPKVVVLLLIFCVCWVSCVFVFLLKSIKKLLKSGMVDYNGHGLRVNSLDLVERRLRFAHTFITSARAEFSKGLDEIGILRLDLILEKVYDEIAIRIVVNHMTDTKDYIDRIWDFVSALTMSIATPGSFTEDKQSSARDMVENLVHKLVRMAE